jgi:hypothetical protein
VKRKLENYKDALRDLNRANDLRPDSSWILGCVSVNFNFFFPNSSTSTGVLTNSTEMIIFHMSCPLFTLSAFLQNEKKWVMEL